MNRRRRKEGKEKIAVSRIAVETEANLASARHGARQRGHVTGKEVGLRVRREKKKKKVATQHMMVASGPTCCDHRGDDVGEVFTTNVWTSNASSATAGLLSPINRSINYNIFPAKLRPRSERRDLRRDEVRPPTHGPRVEASLASARAR